MQGICGPCRRLLCDNKPFDCEGAALREDFWKCKSCHDTQSKRVAASGKKRDGSCDFAKPTPREKAAWNTFKSLQPRPTRKSVGKPLEPPSPSLDNSEILPNSDTINDQAAHATVENRLSEDTMQDTQDSQGFNQPAHQQKASERPRNGNGVGSSNATADDGAWAALLSHRPPTPPISRRGSRASPASSDEDSASTYSEPYQIRRRKSRSRAKDKRSKPSSAKISLRPSRRVSYDVSYAIPDPDWSEDEMDVVADEKPAGDENHTAINSPTEASPRDDDRTAKVEVEQSTPKLFLRFKAPKKKRQASLASVIDQADEGASFVKRVKVAEPFMRNEELMERWTTSSASRSIVNESHTEEGTESRPLDLVSQDGSQESASPRMPVVARRPFSDDDDYISKMISRSKEKSDDDLQAPIPEPWTENGAEVDAFRPNSSLRTKNIRRKMKETAQQKESKDQDRPLDCQETRVATNEERSIEAPALENGEKDESIVAKSDKAVSQLPGERPNVSESASEVSVNVLDQPSNRDSPSRQAQQDMKDVSSQGELAPPAPSPSAKTGAVPGPEEDRTLEPAPKADDPPIAALEGYSISGFSPINRPVIQTQRGHWEPPQPGEQVRVIGKEPKRIRRLPTKLAKKKAKPVLRTSFAPLLPSGQPTGHPPASGQTSGYHSRNSSGRPSISSPLLGSISSVIDSPAFNSGAPQPMPEKYDASFERGSRQTSIPNGLPASGVEQLQEEAFEEERIEGVYHTFPPSDLSDAQAAQAYNQGRGFTSQSTSTQLLNGRPMSREETFGQTGNGPGYHAHSASSQFAFRAAEIAGHSRGNSSVMASPNPRKRSVESMEDHSMASQQSEAYAPYDKLLQPGHRHRVSSDASTASTKEKASGSPAKPVEQFGPEKVRSSYPFLMQPQKVQTGKAKAASASPSTKLITKPQREGPLPMRTLNQSFDDRHHYPEPRQMVPPYQHAGHYLPSLSTANTAYPSPETPSTAGLPGYIDQSQKGYGTRPPPPPAPAQVPRKGRGRPRLQTASRTDQTRAIAPAPAPGSQQPAPPRRGSQQSPQYAYAASAPQTGTQQSPQYVPDGAAPAASRAPAQQHSLPLPPTGTANRVPAQPSALQSHAGTPVQHTFPHALFGAQQPKPSTTSPSMQSSAHMGPPNTGPHPQEGGPPPPASHPQPGQPTAPSPSLAQVHRNAALYQTMFTKHLRETRLRIFQPASNAFEVVHFGDSRSAHDLFAKILKTAEVSYEQVKRVCVTFDWMAQDNRARTMVLKRDDGDVSFGHVHDEIQARFRMSGYCRTLIDVDVVLKE